MSTIPFSSLLVIATILTTISTSYAAPPALESQTDMYLRAVWGLAVVLGVMLIVYGFVRKRFSLAQNQGDKKIKIIEMRPIMPKKTLCLVEVEGKQILLGISGDNINHLANITESSTTSFSELLAEAKNE